MVLVPVAWLGDHVQIPEGLTAERLAADLVRVGLEEEAIHTGEVTGPVVVGRVLDVTPEPQKNGKTINWCHVDVGEDAPRGIVCGAHNFDAGDWVVVALPGAVLPGGFEIAARKTYGHVSDGMIASVRELGIGDDHSGILVLTRTGFDAADLVAGADALALLGLDEQVLEINVTPDRGYCFSMRGVAREYAHATGAAFTDRGLPGPAEQAPVSGGFGVELADQAPIDRVPGCDRFVAQIVRGVDAAAPSPAWMQRRLVQAGMRPISLAVDVTNYVMLDLGQPIHAYDLAALAEPIVVRRARPAEHLVTLDGQDRALHVEDLLITDSPDGQRGARGIGLAGVMGGLESETAEATADLLIEAAHFDPVSIARTARRHRLSSEAAKRFERGVDTHLQRVAVARVVELLTRYGGGVADETATDVGTPAAPATVTFSPQVPARLVGVPYTDAQVSQTLEAIGCQVSQPAPDGRVQVTAPTWRPDLTAPEDLVEEVARIRGYDEIPSVVPAAAPGTGLTRSQRVRRAVADALAADGLVEVLSYPFVGPDAFDAMGLEADDPRRNAVRLANPLVDTQPLMRTNLLATLLDTTRRNIGRGNVDIALFELGLVTAPASESTGGLVAPVRVGGTRPDDATLGTIRGAVPDQPRHVAAVLTGRRAPSGWWGPGREVEAGDAIAAALHVASIAGAELTLQAAATAPWHPGRCAALRIADGQVVGHAGELHPNVVTTFDLPARSAAFELDLDALLAAGGDPVQARPVSSFPVAKEDLAFVVDASVPAAQVAAAVREAAGEWAEDVRLFDVYTGVQVPGGTRSLAFALRLRAPDRTLTAEDTASVRRQVVSALATRFGATLRT
ncbi:MAG: phenylalanine--tRNA ligase subunit beta [Micrococcales bacterium]|nr:phenylalanine--tRNA ligase subunit beta [Micrococcales bacterium]